VVAPNTAKDSVWGDELRRFCPWLEVIVLGNTPKQREKALRRVEYLTDNDQPFVFVVHYEALAIIAGKTVDERDDGKKKTVLGKGWNKLGIWDLLVADESHRLANTGAQMFKAYMKIHRAAVLDLSGSIVQHNLEELYSPHRRAFPKLYSNKWKHWNDRFLDYAEGGYGKILIGVKEDRIEELRTELGSWMAYRRKEDELDLPPKTYVDRRVDLSPAQRKAYDELKATCLTEIGDERIKASEGIAMLGKLRQIATGLSLVAPGVEFGDGPHREEFGVSSKIDAAVDDIMDAPDSDFVVFSWYKAGVWATQTARGAGRGVLLRDGRHPAQGARRIHQALPGGRGPGVPRDAGHARRVGQPPARRPGHPPGPFLESDDQRTGRGPRVPHGADPQRDDHRLHRQGHGGRAARAAVPGNQAGRTRGDPGWRVSALDLVALTCIGDMDDFWFIVQRSLGIRTGWDNYYSADVSVQCALATVDYHEED
jgi:hypothetical protein